MKWLRATEVNIARMLWEEFGRRIDALPETLSPSDPRLDPPGDCVDRATTLLWERGFKTSNAHACRTLPDWPVISYSASEHTGGAVYVTYGHNVREWVAFHEYSKRDIDRDEDGETWGGAFITAMHLDGPMRITPEIGRLIGSSFGLQEQSIKPDAIAGIAPLELHEMTHHAHRGNVRQVLEQLLSAEAEEVVCTSFLPEIVEQVLTSHREGKPKRSGLSIRSCPRVVDSGHGNMPLIECGRIREPAYARLQERYTETTVYWAQLLPAQQLQDDVPVENLLALIDVAKNG